MNQSKLIKNFRSLNWDVWLKRELPVLVVYLMAENATKTAFAKYGLKGEWPIILYEDHIWYGNEKMFAIAGVKAKSYLKKVTTDFLVKICEKGYRRALREVEKMNADIHASPVRQFKKFITLLNPINLSVWTAHGSEEYFHQELRKKLAPLVESENLEKFIGDVGFPQKKNAYALMADDILHGVTVAELYRKYAWLKSRIYAGFGAGYSLGEIGELRRNILKNPPRPVTRPSAPKDLDNLLKQFQNIVYLRTLRTDSLFEIYFRAQPTLIRIAKYFGVDSVAHYLPEDLLSDTPVRYDNHFAILKYYDQLVVTKERIAQKRIVRDTDVISGVVARSGQATGKVRIVLRPSDTTKVKKGDILVTNMTTPAYLSSMELAAATVTDEGGITCHAAILSRELKKPCVIGTKIATKVFKDGDLVEVDAEKGVVRKL